MISAFGVEHGSEISKGVKLPKPATGIVKPVRNAWNGLMGNKPTMVRNMDRKTAIKDASNLKGKKGRKAMKTAQAMPKKVTDTGFDTGADARKWMKKNPLTTAGIATGTGVAAGGAAGYGLNQRYS